MTRHGQIEAAGDYPTGYAPISVLGHRQAAKLGERLVQLDFKGCVYSSPYHRCLETAEIICRATDTHFYPEPRIGEVARDSIVEFTGYTIDEIKARFRRCRADARMEWPWWPEEVESPEDVAARVGPFICSLETRAVDQVLLIGHGASASACALHLCGERSSHYNAALSAFHLPSRSALMRNDTEHLGRGEVTNNKKVVA